MRKQTKELGVVIDEAVKKLQKDTLWVDGLESESFMAFKVLKINGREYLVIPKNVILHHVNDDLRLIDQR